MPIHHIKVHPFGPRTFGGLYLLAQIGKIGS
jgi:hypothetical protein